MIETVKLLQGNFVVIDLGSFNASDLNLGEFSQCVVLVEVDAGGQSRTKPTKYHKRFSIQKAVGSKREKRTFYIRRFSGASSFLQPDSKLIKDYGLEDFYVLADSVEMECEPIEDILSLAGVERVVFLKTDLEGLDFEILSSAPEVISSTLVVQSELRFQPFYAGEPYFHTVVAHLTDLRFELITMRPAVWKYNTPNGDLMRDGRLVWADTIFFLKPDRVQEIFGGEAPQAFLKQIILAKSLELHNYAEYIYERVKPNLSAPVQQELEGYLCPRFGMQLLLIQAANLVASIPGGGRILLIFRNLLLSALRALSVYRGTRTVATLY